MTCCYQWFTNSNSSIQVRSMKFPLDGSCRNRLTKMTIFTQTLSGIAIVCAFGPLCGLRLFFIPVDIGCSPHVRLFQVPLARTSFYGLTMTATLDSAVEELLESEDITRMD
ncbi:hypothetical protein TNCV_4641891 [Trichonephila clavipes]|nr:hypothetical protein TNCV_4641891 [Trichonephila clavipes]